MVCVATLLLKLLILYFLTFQVFFCVMIGSFSIGNAAPNIGSFVTAKGAAAVVYEIIDRVS